MKKLYWNSEVQYNWQGDLREEMLDRNVLCYGKPKSGKTEKVAKPFMRRAIARADSIILVINNDQTDYSDIYELALDRGYMVEDYDVAYRSEFDGEQIGEMGDQLMDRLMSEQLLLRVHVDPVRGQEYNSLLAFFYGMILSEREQEESDRWNISLVVEDSDWQVLLPQGIQHLNWLNFCITTPASSFCAPTLIAKRLQSLRKRAGLSDGRLHLEKDPVRSELSAAIHSGNHQKAKDILDGSVHINDYFSSLASIMPVEKFSLAYPEDISEAEKKVEELARSDTLRAIRSFLAGVETVICTGVSGISPDEHRAFVQCCLVSACIRIPSGKFLVTDLTAPFRAAPKSVFPKTVMQYKKEPVEGLLQCQFPVGWCVIEQNGIVKLFAEADGMLTPLCFRSCSAAMDWVENYFMQMGWGWPEPAEVDDCNVRYLLPAQEDGGKQDEIIISYIQKEDVQCYVDQMLLILLEVEEYLKDPKKLEAVPGLEKGREAANVTMQKLVAYVCQDLNRVQKSDSKELPFDEEAQQQVISMIEEYKWRPYQKVKAEPIQDAEQAIVQLPEKRVLFMGGHANMVKKLRQYFPDWDFLSDDEFGSWTGGECDVIFFWSNHCSHSLQHYVEARKSKEVPYLYVTATNINRLVGEMLARYTEYIAKQQPCAC